MECILVEVFTCSFSLCATLGTLGFDIIQAVSHYSSDIYVMCINYTYHSTLFEQYVGHSGDEVCVQSRSYNFSERDFETTISFGTMYSSIMLDTQAILVVICTNCGILEKHANTTRHISDGWSFKCW